MKKPILMLLAPTDFRDIEYIVPRAFFEAYGYDVKTTSTEFQSVGKFGYPVQHDLLLDEVEAVDYAGVFVVGGLGSLDFIENETAKHLITVFANSKKPTASICAAPRNFLAWGLLADKKATGHNWDNQFPVLCADSGAKYLDEPVVVDQNIITAQGPTASEALALAFMEYLG